MSLVKKAQYLKKQSYNVITFEIEVLYINYKVVEDAGHKYKTNLLNGFRYNTRVAPLKPIWATACHGKWKDERVLSSLAEVWVRRDCIPWINIMTGNSLMKHSHCFSILIDFIFLVRQKPVCDNRFDVEMFHERLPR